MTNAYVVVPHGPYIPGVFTGTHSAAILAIAARRWGVGSISTNVFGIDIAREDALRKVLADEAADRAGMGPDYLLWLDTDIVANFQHFDKLLSYAEAHPEADAVTALYYKRIGGLPVLYDAVPDPDNDVYGYKFIQRESAPEKPGEIGAAGFGCMLLRMKPVREKLMPKFANRKLFWFSDPVPSIYSTMPWGQKQSVAPLAPAVAPVSRPYAGEDLNFCGLMLAAGMKLHVAPFVTVGHYGAIIDDSNHTALKNIPDSLIRIQV